MKMATESDLSILSFRDLDQSILFIIGSVPKNPSSIITSIKQRGKVDMKK